jgi:hypothetical protein
MDSTTVAVKALQVMYYALSATRDSSLLGMVILSSPASDASEVHDSGKKFSTILTSSCANSEPDFLHCRLLKQIHGRLSLYQFKVRFPFRLDVHDSNRFSDLNMVLYTISSLHHAQHTQTYCSLKRSPNVTSHQSIECHPFPQPLQ